MEKDIFAAVLSFFIPGLGQAYAGDIKKGLIFFVISLVFVVIGSFIFKSWIVWLILFIYALYASYDAYQMVIG